MFATEYRVSPAYPQAAPSLLAQEPLILQPERSRVRHVLYGSSKAVRHTISELHQKGYVEQFRWDPVLPIPANGILITPDHGKVYAFLMRELLLG